MTPVEASENYEALAFRPANDGSALTEYDHSNQTHASCSARLILILSMFC